MTLVDLPSEIRKQSACFMKKCDSLNFYLAGICSKTPTLSAKGKVEVKVMKFREKASERILPELIRDRTLYLEWYSQFWSKQLRTLKSLHENLHSQGWQGEELQIWQPTPLCGNDWYTIEDYWELMPPELRWTLNQDEGVFFNILCDETMDAVEWWVPLRLRYLDVD